MPDTREKRGASGMRNKLKSLRFRILLPVIVMVLFIVTLLNTVCSRAFIRMIFDQEQEVNAIGFATVSNSVVPMINAAVSEVRNILSDDRVASYARFQFANQAELIRARKSCRDFLRAEISSRERIFGLLFMRTDGSLFGVLPEANLFLDDPKDNPDAKKYQTISIDEVIERNLKVVDMTASILAKENRMSMYVFGLNEENSIVRAARGTIDGTSVTV
jgi:hypothetical protein